VGWCFGLLLAVDPSAFYYGREARMYALWELLTLLGLWGAVSFAKSRSRGALALAAFAQLLACYTHNVALFGVAGIALVTLLLLEDRRSRSTWILVHAGVGLLYLPWFLVVLAQLSQQRVVLAWFTPHWEDQGALWHAADSIAALTTGAFPSWMGLSAPWSARIPSVAVALLLAVSGAIALRREGAVRIFALSALSFLLLCLAYSVAVQPIFIPGRTDRALLAPLVFLISVHVDLAPWRRTRTAVVAAWGLLCLALVLHQYGEAPKSAAAPVWTALAERVQPGDVMVAAGLAAGQASYVHHRSRTGSVFEFFPASAGRHVGYTSFRSLRQQRGALRTEARSSASRWAAALGGSGRLWLVWSGDPEFGPLEQAILERFRLEQVAARGALPLIGDPVELRAYRR
jgi:cell division protein FtsW (lipid II flippase)